MMRWIERRFDFSFPADLYPSLIERLRGTPLRLAYWVGATPPGVLTLRDGDAWSIQENVGHLLDLEPLFAGRLDDFLSGAEILRGADMTNAKTNEAGHNDRAIESILRDFREARAGTVERLEALAPGDFARTARHPRLDSPMRLVDSVYFQAEHDDHHLARIAELARRGS